MPKNLSKKRIAAKRSASAKKGWATRLANVRARSEAAKRGWKTRRKNEKKFSGGTVGIGKKRKKVPPKRSMWAVTIAAPYFIRRFHKRKKRRVQDSPASAAYMVQGWFRNEALARKATPKLVRLAIAGRKRAVAAHPNAYDMGIEPDVERKRVPYKAGFIGRIEETDEH